MIDMEKALILLKVECLGDNCLENVLGKIKDRKR